MIALPDCQHRQALDARGYSCRRDERTVSPGVCAVCQGLDPCEARPPGPPPMPPSIQRIASVCQQCEQHARCAWANSPRCKRERILRERKPQVLASCCPAGTWGGPVDFVWGYYAPAAQGDELLYSVRSVMANFNGIPRIWIVCDPADRPTWASTQVRFIDYQWRRGNRRTRRPFDFTEKVLAACREPEVGVADGHFCSMYDDIYFVNPVILPDFAEPRAVRKWTRAQMERWHPRRKWDRRRRKSLRVFADATGTAWDFSTHMPYWFHKERFLEVARRYCLRHKDFLRETIYFNFTRPKDRDPAPREVKSGPRIQWRTCSKPSLDVLDRETRGVLLLNHCDKSWTPAMERLLASRFPEPCAAERDVRAKAYLPVGTVGHVPVIMCIWQRPESFAKTLAMLQAQTFPPEDFTFYVWNNNPDLRERLEQVAAETPHDFGIIFHHHAENIGPIARAHQAHELARTGQYRYVVTIDDDQILPPDFLATLVAEAAPRTITSDWAWRFKTPTSYWKRYRPAVHAEAEYCGVGGAIFDISLFADPAVLDIPAKYRLIDDLWLSYFARQRGWRLRRSAAMFMPMERDSKGLAPRLATLKTQFRQKIEAELLTRKLPRAAILLSLSQAEEPPPANRR